jgi:simple sugar transport system substrate-binding protein
MKLGNQRGRARKALFMLGSGIVVLALTMSTASATTAGSSVSSKLSASCAGQKPFTIYYATHAFPHPFFTAMENGAKDGARAACAKMTWTQSPSGYDINDTVNRIEAGIAQHPNVLVVAMVDPKAETAAIKQANAAGILVINVNVQDTQPIQDQPKYLSYIGLTSEFDTGVAAAQQILAVNPHPKLAAVANPAPGDPGLTPRVQGFEQVMKTAGVHVDSINVSSNASQVLNTYMVAHPQLDALYTLANGLNGSDAAAQAAAKLGRSKTISLVCTDYSKTDLLRIKAGTQVASITQQQYLQGYLPATLARLYYQTGQIPQTVSTGPGVINKSNVNQAILEYAAGKA